jgi:rSAM/selenodomain-associated transferase 2/rSAM/selenodomain-associated transferase 1
MTEVPTSLDRLILFTRYPEPGKAKTRLIPALGATGAAELHRQMAEHTVSQARSLRSQHPVSVEVQFASGTVERMQTWLGEDLAYQLQAPGDLGDRLAHAFQSAFAVGMESVIVIGTDCPELDAAILAQAFAALQSHDLVLGGAIDGGYYLIGLRRLVPALFQGIAWSTAAVFQQTMTIAAQAGLTIATLPVLADVDYPEDLAVWQRVSTKISIVIPTFNAADHLTQTLSTLQLATNIEIIIVDGGSTDKTVEIAGTIDAQVLTTTSGRAHQMNIGARVATGEILLFLHADTQLPTGFDRHIRTVLDQPGVIAGAFELRIRGTQPSLRLVEWGVRWRSRLWQMPYGDQAIFLKSSVFRDLDGFPELPIMEDFEIIRRLKRLGRVAIVPACVVTSGQRWQQLGVWRTTLINQWIIAAYLLGVDPDRLSQWYWGKPTKP